MGDSEGSQGVNIPAGVTGTTIENSTISGINATSESLGSAVFNGGGGTGPINCTPSVIKNNYVYNVGGGAPGSGGGNACVENNYELVNATIPEEHYEPIYCTDDTLTISHNTLINMHSQTWCGNFWDDNLAYLNASDNNMNNTAGAACPD